MRILIPYTGETRDTMIELVNEYRPVFHDLANIMKAFKQDLIDIGEDPLDFDVTVDPKTFGYMAPKELAGDQTMYAINPFLLSHQNIGTVEFTEAASRAGANTASLQASMMTLTLIHEYSHRSGYRDGTESFEREIHRVTLALGRKDFTGLSKISSNLRRFYETHGETIEKIAGDLQNIYTVGNGFNQYIEGLTTGQTSELRKGCTRIY